MLQGAGSWLLPFKDGQPPLGWGETISYLILPVLLVVSQFFSQKIMSPQTDDPQQQQTQKYLQFLPLLIGRFCLSCTCTGWKHSAQVVQCVLFDNKQVVPHDD